jgi:DNA cross-link repair 1C protein
MDLEQVIRAIAKKSLQTSSTGPTASPRIDSAGMSTAAVEEDQHGIANLPKTICFPYSRHSSYPELCAFVDAFKPKDVWPCTADPDEWIRNDTSIESLFGRFCSEDEFSYDEFLRARRPVAVDLLSDKDSQQAYDTQRTLTSSPKAGSFLEPAGPTVSGREHASSVRGKIDSPPSVPQHASRYSDIQPSLEQAAASNSNEEQDGGLGGRQSDNPSGTGGSRKRYLDECNDSEAERNHNWEDEAVADSQQSQISIISDISYRDSVVRHDAYARMRDLARGDEDWVSVSLISTDAGHTNLEKDLGSSDDVKGQRYPKLH